MAGARDARTLLRDAVLVLKAADIENPVADARILLQFTMQVSREELLRDPELSFTDAECDRFMAFVARRAGREPISHLTGQREFWGLPFQVNHDVLDPRPDSESLVEAVLFQIEDKKRPLSILDLGTGSGCLLLALLHELTNAWGVGVDVSEAALAIAKSNALALALADRATFCRAHWADAISGRFDIIISNPPYIVEGDIQMLAPEVSQHDPLLALSGGADGLAAYRHIAFNINTLLSKNGWVAIECGAGQWNDVATILANPNLNAKPAIHDLNGIPRVFLAQAGNP